MERGKLGGPLILSLEAVDDEENKKSIIDRFQAKELM